MNELIRVFTGSTVDANMLKKHLQKIDVKAYVENNVAEKISQWEQSSFNPNVDLKVEVQDVEKSLKFIEDFFK